jgi:hypothetical protein
MVMVFGREFKKIRHDKKGGLQQCFGMRSG